MGVGDAEVVEEFAVLLGRQHVFGDRVWRWCPVSGVAECGQERFPVGNER